MKNFIPWIVVILLFFFIVALAVLLGLGFFSPDTSTNPVIDDLLNDISLQNGWDPVEGSPVTGERGECLLYPTFSVETSVVDQIEPIGSSAELPAEFQCDDGFTMLLEKRSRVCAQAECLGSNGNLYTTGDTETFYSECGQAKPCPNGRSAIVLNFNIERGIVSSKARCLTYQNDTFNVAPCPAETSQSDSQFFLNVDQIPVTYTTNLVRIRAPGTVNCLLPNGNGLIVSPCLSDPNEGYSWLFTPKICIPNTDPPGSQCYPEQIATIPTGIEDLDFENPEAVLALLKTVESIQLSSESSQNLVLKPYGLCTNYSSAGCSNPPNDPNYCNGYEPPSLPTNDNCQFKTAIISAYSYQNLF